MDVSATIPPPDGADHPTSRPARGLQHSSDGATRPVLWQVPEEAPIALMYNSTPFAVMMASPADLRDFALGFTLSERIAAHRSSIRNIICLTVDQGWCVDVAVDGEVSRQRRGLEGRTGCGLCGVEEIGQVIREQSVVRRTFTLDPLSVERSFRELPDHQPINRENKSVHAAAWCRPSGEVLFAREDVGRHNALDKLIGAVAAAEGDFSSGFVCMSSRCSFELVQKAASVGIPYLVTLSAPTSFALEVARQANLGIGSRSGDGAVLFNC
jgi:FdhD protein